MKTLTSEDQKILTRLNTSIIYEQNKKKVETKEQYIVRLEAQRSTLELHLKNLLSRFEATWDRIYMPGSDLNEDVLSVEEMIEYIEAAKFMHKYFGRDICHAKTVEEIMKAKGI